MGRLWCNWVTGPQAPALSLLWVALFVEEHNGCLDT